MNDIAKEIFSSPPKLPQINFSEKVNQKKIVLYGLGAGFHSFTQFVLNRYGLTPNIFIDEKAENSTALNKFTPKEFFLKFLPNKHQDLYILVTIGNRKIFEDVKENFRRHGFNCVHSVLDVYEYNLCYASIEIEEGLHEILQANSMEINQAYSLLSDEESRNIFRKILVGHWNRIPILSENYSPEMQYIVDGIGLTEKDISLLDCGAYDGDTLVQFSKRYGRLNLAVALECDLQNYEKMMNKTFPNIERLIALPVGSADRVGQLFFNNDKKMQSRLNSEADSNDKKTVVSVIDCDNAFRGIHFNRVVIDTEGYEKQSLSGMRHIISSQCPDITVAAYHYPTDFYEIINLINSLKPGYKYYFRNHSPFVAETVLYAVKNR